MDAPEPDTPFAAVSAQTTRLRMVSEPFTSPNLRSVFQHHAFWIGISLVLRLTNENL